MSSEPTLVPYRALVEFAIGGGWGAETAEDGSQTAVTVIRGTDFERARDGELGGCPQRYETQRRVSKRALTTGDIVLEISGGNPKTGQSTGRSLFVSQGTLAASAAPVIPASFCRLVRINRRVAVPRFAFYLLQDMWLSGRARRYENQSTGISNFQFEYFLDEEQVWLPDHEEQERIAGLLGALDDKIDSNRRLATLLAKAAATAFRARFTELLGVEKLVDSRIGPIPSGWKVETVADIAEVVRDSIHPAETPDELFESFSIPAFDRGQEPELALGHTMLSAKTPLPDGDCVLVSKLNPQRSWRIWWPGPSRSSRAICSPEFVVLAPREQIPTSYLFDVFSSADWLRNHILGHLSGTTGSRQRVKPSEILSAPALIPPADALRDWDDFAGPLYRHARLLRRECRSLLAVRDTLLPKLVSGEKAAT
jgi:type I restriction enzyme, S subunit